MEQHIKDNMEQLGEALMSEEEEMKNDVTPDAAEGERESEGMETQGASDVEVSEEEAELEEGGVKAPLLEDTPENHLRMLEAVLFASAKPISPQAMLERLPEGADLNVLLPELQKTYEGRGVSLVEVGGNWAMRTSADVEQALVVEKEVSRKMSKAALETLSIVAYHQPITRAEIENIRGVATHKGTLDILMEMGWVKPGRRRETPGRPLTWVTTHDFLDHFQLETLNDLPGLEELKASGLLDKRAAIDTLPDTGDLFDDADVDAQEVLEKTEGDRSDEDAYDEASYKELKARAEKENQAPIDETAENGDK